MSPNGAIQDFYIEVGRRVRDARSSLSMTQETLARHLELTRSSVANLEAGRQRIQLHTFATLASVLGADVRELMPPIVAARGSSVAISSSTEYEDETTREFVEQALLNAPQGK